MSGGMVLTVGNTLMGDDGAGPFLAQLLEATPAAGWSVLDGGATPENVTHIVRAEAPDHVLLVDAADMQLPPGSVCRIDEADVAKQFLITTHAIPLDVLIASLRETVPRVTFVGIQPAVVAFFGDMTPRIKSAVLGLHRSLTLGMDPEDLPTVAQRHDEAATDTPSRELEKETSRG
jgi:hydrogenase 3 maturation protease